VGPALEGAHVLTFCLRRPSFMKFFGFIFGKKPPAPRRAGVPVLRECGPSREVTETERAWLRWQRSQRSQPSLTEQVFSERDRIRQQISAQGQSRFE